MRAPIHTLNQLYEAYPELTPESSVLVTIATAEPRDLNNALQGTINHYEYTLGLQTREQERLQNTLDIEVKSGENMQSIYKQSADRLTEIQDTYTARGEVPPADLMDKIYADQALYEMPAEMHGMGMMGKLPDMHIDMLRQTHADLSEQAGAYEIARTIKPERDKLGRPARLITWVGGLALLAGLSVGAAAILNNPKDKEVPPAQEVINDIAPAMILSPTILIPTSIAAHGASNRLARKRAKRQLNKQA